MKSRNSSKYQLPVPQGLKRIRQFMVLGSVFLGIGILLITLGMYVILKPEEQHLVLWLSMGAQLISAALFGIAANYRGILENQEKEKENAVKKGKSQ